MHLYYIFFKSGDEYLILYTKNRVKKLGVSLDSGTKISDIQKVDFKLAGNSQFVIFFFLQTLKKVFLTKYLL